MKNIIRKWLGIEDIDLRGYVKSDDIKEAVENAMYQAFQDELGLGTYWRYDRHVNIRGQLNKCVTRIIGDTAEIEVRNKIEKIIAPERFIDDVVQRIKTKQIK